MTGKLFSSSLKGGQEAALTTLATKNKQVLVSEGISSENVKAVNVLLKTFKSTPTTFKRKKKKERMF